MPLFGVQDVQKLEREIPVTGELGHEAWEAEGASVLNVVYEIGAGSILELIPPALHPAIPPYVTITARKIPTSPVGPFTMAETRIMSRAGVHYGGYLTGGFVDSDDAAELLREHYGYSLRVASIALERAHYGMNASVTLDGRTVLDVSLEHPEPISGKDIMYTAGFNLARLPDDRVRLVQVEPEYTFDEAYRGPPRLRTFDAQAFGDGRVEITNPLPATYSRCTFKMCEVRYLMDPEKNPLEGTERL